MISLSEHLNQMFICESFQSDIIRNEVFPSIKYTTFKKAYKWDLITDDDLERLEPDEALKLARKRNESNIIIWMNDSDHNVVAITNGSFPHYVHSKYFGKVPTIPSVYKVSEYAYLLKNAQRFDTRDLRDERIKAKQNALAFKSNEEVARENLKRYESLKNQKSAGDKEEIWGWINSAFGSYKECMKDTIPSLLQAAKETLFDNERSLLISNARNMWDTLNLSISQMMNSVDSLSLSLKDAERYSDYQNIASARARDAKNEYDKIQGICKNLRNIADQLSEEQE